VVPDYTVNRVLRRDNHYEGGWMFQDRIVVEATPPEDDQIHDTSQWDISWGLQSQTPNAAPKRIEKLEPLLDGTGYGFGLELPQYASPPSMKARLRIEARPWNRAPRIF
jgi:hypothetical protein